MEMIALKAFIVDESRHRVAFIKEASTVSRAIEAGEEPDFEKLKKCKDDYGNLLARIREERGYDISKHLFQSTNYDLKKATKPMTETIEKLEERYRERKSNEHVDKISKQEPKVEKEQVKAEPGAASFTGDSSEKDIATEGREQRNRVKDAKARINILNTQLKSINTAITVQQKNLDQYRKKKKRDPRYAQTLEAMTERLNKLIDAQGKYNAELVELKAIISSKGMTKEDVARQESANNQKQFEDALQNTSKAYSEEMKQMHEDFENSKKESAEALAKSNELLLAMQMVVDELKAKNEELTTQNAELSKPALQKLKEKTQKQLNSAAENIKKAFKKQEKLQTAFESFCTDDSTFEIAEESKITETRAKLIVNRSNKIIDDAIKKAKECKTVDEFNKIYVNAQMKTAALSRSIGSNGDPKIGKIKYDNILNTDKRMEELLALRPAEEAIQSDSYTQSVKNTISSIKEEIRRLERQLHAATDEDDIIDIKAEIDACKKMLAKYESKEIAMNTQN